MGEEHRCQAPPEGHRLCANNCGFIGSPATMNLCSKCYRDFCLKEQQQASIKSTVENSLSASAASSSSSSSLSLSSSSKPSIEPLSLSSPPPPYPTAAVATPSFQDGVVSQPNRCLVCRKRVGLTGFTCRCGTTFCGAHRYPEKHGCTFDFKTMGREEIARANPVVKADKLDRI